MRGKDLLSVSDLNGEEVRLLISNAVDMKAEGWGSLLGGKTLAIMFEKPSLRTRVSFEVAMRQLGGQTIYLSPAMWILLPSVPFLTILWRFWLNIQIFQ